MDFHLGKGQVESKKYSVLFILWQPHQPELQQLNLSPKITSFDADTGDGESILQKIFGLQRTQEWKNIRIVNTRADDRNTPASYQIEIEISPVYCVS